MTATAVAQSGARGLDLLLSLGLPILLAFLVHAMAIFALVEGWSVGNEVLSVPQVAVLNARLIELQGVAPSVPERALEQPAPSRRSDVIPVPETQPEPVDVVPEPEPDPIVEPQSTRPVDIGDNELRKLLDQSLDEAIAAEDEALSSADEAQAIASFVGAIKSSIERHWSRPPSARNGMRVEVRIGLVPTGELVAVDVVASSGNVAFDRSAQVAVRDAAPFEVPQDLALFEREFRSLRILFRPEDMRN